MTWLNQTPGPLGNAASATVKSRLFNPVKQSGKRHPVGICRPGRIFAIEHWRRQRHGPGLTLMTPRWTSPTLFKKDNGPTVESRIYDIQNPPADPQPE
jgi:hypothetical protein